MFKLYSSILFIFLANFCNAQGSWNIGYRIVDSIDKKYIGQVVRIDFKSKNPRYSPDGQRYTRSYVGTKDTGVINFGTTIFMLAERRKIYADHGSYSDQYLECINCDKGTLFIYDAEILKVDERSIEFRLNIAVKLNGQTKSSEARIVRIDKNMLDGVLYKK